MIHYIKKITELENIICSDPSPDILEEHWKTKKQLKDMYAEKSYGSFIRSRCKHLEDFEKLTKYFLGLDKANHKVKHLRNLKYEGKSYTVPAEILQIQHDYFSKIYTEKYNGSFDTDIDNY